MTIAVLGGYGDVGAAACRFLFALKLGPIKIGGRNAEKYKTEDIHLKSSNSKISNAKNTGLISYQNVDIADDKSLNDFLSGCSLLINCAGPSHLIGDKVALAAANHNIHYIDAAGDDPLYQQLDNNQYKNRGLCAILSTGLQPGLTALFPKWLAQKEFDEVSHLISYFGLLDRFTSVAAEDFLTGAKDGHNQPLAAWRNGKKQFNALNRQSEVELPYFPNRVNLFPYLNTEGQRLAEEINLESGDWFNAIAGQHILKAFNQAHGLPLSEAKTALVRGSELDLSGRKPYVIFLLQLSGKIEGRKKTITAVLKGMSNADLTGAMIAITASQIIGNQIESGVHFCGQILSPTTAINMLQNLGTVSQLSIFPSNIESILEPEEGEI